MMGKQRDKLERELSHIFISALKIPRTVAVRGWSARLTATLQIHTTTCISNLLSVPRQGAKPAAALSPHPATATPPRVGHAPVAPAEISSARETSICDGQCQG